MTALAIAAPGAIADPAAPPAAPSEELLEYLGTWNGDEDWLQSEATTSVRAAPDPEPATRTEPDRAPARDPSE